MKKLGRDFYERNVIDVAKGLVGKVISYDDMMIRITETEAYSGLTDKACHAYKNKKTNRTEVLFENGGVVYVYMIYGMYFCMNVVANKKDIPEAVLIRGAEFFDKDNEKLCINRYNCRMGELSKYRLKNFLNGPGKICKALGIDKNLNGADLCADKIKIYDMEDFKGEIKAKKRINIDYAQEAADFEWRFCGY